MNSVDLALAALLLLCALRGYWRGFFRESFGLLALVGGVVAATELSAAGVVLLHEYVQLPPVFETGAVFVAIFVVVHTAINLLGVLLDRLAGALFLRGITRLTGAVLGAAKGAAVLAFVLLFLHLFPVVPKLDVEIMNSSVAPPLMTAATRVIRLGLHGSTEPSPKSKT